jgi:hypothetical protein
MARSWVQEYREVMDRSISERSVDVSSGSATSYEDYSHKVGVIEGLEIARREFLEIIQRMDNVQGSD